MTCTPRPPTMRDDANFTKIEQETYLVPNITIKELLSTIPSHCFRRSAVRSSAHILLDILLIWIIFVAASKLDLLLSNYRSIYPNVHSLAHFCLWTMYGFAAGLPGTGLWVIAHECGHQAFSESKTINNTVGWVLHSALGVPFHSWRISHAKHHANTGHMTNDQVFVPHTRSARQLPPLDSQRENMEGSRVQLDVQHLYEEIIGDSPIIAFLSCVGRLLFGWPLYLIFNMSGQKYECVNHFIPRAPLYTPNQFWQVMISDAGVVLWITALAYWTYARGLSEMLRIYFVPYLWVNHWLILVTFLQHTDPRLPHYRAESFTFTRGALSTLDRSLMGGPSTIGKMMGWIGGTTTHGISETHVAHHVASRIPHYHAWDAAKILRKLLTEKGYDTDGGYATWGEVYRVYQACKFVEDEGDVVFYKDGRGFAQRVAVWDNPISDSVSDSGVDVSEKR